MRRSIQGKSAANSPLKLTWPSLRLGTTQQHLLDVIETGRHIKQISGVMRAGLRPGS